MKKRINHKSRKLFSEHIIPFLLILEQYCDSMIALKRENNNFLLAMSDALDNAFYFQYENRFDWLFAELCNQRKASENQFIALNTLIVERIDKLKLKMTKNDLRCHLLYRFNEIVKNIEFMDESMYAYFLFNEDLREKYSMTIKLTIK